MDFKLRFIIFPSIHLIRIIKFSWDKNSGRKIEGIHLEYFSLFSTRSELPFSNIMLISESIGPNNLIRRGEIICLKVGLSIHSSFPLYRFFEFHVPLEAVFARIPASRPFPDANAKGAKKKKNEPG